MIRSELNRQELLEDFDRITGILAGVGSVLNRKEALQEIELLVSVQEAWIRGLL